LRDLLRRWLPEGAAGRRAGLAIGVNLGVAALALALFVLVSPPSNWGHPELIAALAAIAGVAFFAEVRLKIAAAIYFDATLVLTLLAVAVAGPLPALLVWLVPDALNRLVLRRDPFCNPGLVANAGSFALAALTGYAVLELADPSSMVAAAPALYTAGLVMALVNFTFARVAFAPFYQGSRPGPLIRAEFLDLMPTVLAMLALGVVTAILIPPLGVFALAPLAAVVLLPQMGLAFIVRERSVSRLTAPQATKLYAAAIADVLGLHREERQVIACTADLLDEEGGETEPTGLWSFDAVPHVVQAALYLKERWDGNGWPAGLRSRHTPLASRVLAVARAWSGLTAAGTLQLPQEEAILGLNARAGTEFDPMVVHAAAQVVAEEQAFVRDPNFAPRLHRLPVPRPVRRTRLPAVLAELARPV
jgi:HD-GYP domain-containing protein (c-di-GMP phosphodiesterase class II)